MKQDKVYSVTARFGVTTDSYDSDGTVVEEKPWEAVCQIGEEAVREAMADFVGKISQTVPIYSAVKIAGRKLYEKARAGEVVADLPVRQVEIKKFTLLGLVKDEAGQICEAQFLVEVSSGTYIRSLIHDLGQKLGVGAHVVVLRRESIGELQVTGALLPGDDTKIIV